MRQFRHTYLWLALVVTTQANVLRHRADHSSARISTSQLNFTHNVSVIGFSTVSETHIRTKAISSPWDLLNKLPFWWFFAIIELKGFLVSYWGLIAITSTLYLVLTVMLAYKYRGTESYFPEIGPEPEDPALTRKQLKEWHFAWYQCGNHVGICCLSFCCPWIQWAHTMDLLHLFEYWPAFGMFFMLQVINQATGYAFPGAYFTMLLVYYRQKLRKVFGMQKYGTFGGIVEDWLCLCFCMPCTIAQEAQHIKFAAEMGYPLPACMAENAGRRKVTSSPVMPEDDLEEPGTSSSQSFHDVMSRHSNSCRDSPAMPQSEPLMVFGSLFHHSRATSRSSSRGMGFRNGSRRRSRSSSREEHHRSHRRQAKSSPAAKPKAIVKDASVKEPATLQKGPWHRDAQNPVPERLLAQPPVRVGAPGEVRPNKLNFVQVLVTLHDDLRAYAYLFVEVGCVGHCAASCRTLHAYIWADRAFWQFYCGANVNDRMAQPWACPAHALREAFRRWIFHIDGVWTKDFREFINNAKQSESGADLALMLSYARYIASGLMPYDSRPAIQEFTSIMCELLAEYNPEKSDERNAAEAVTAQVECMGEVFSGAQIKLVLSAFDCSLGRAVSAPSENESDQEPNWVMPGPIGLAEEPEEDVVDPPWGDHEVLWFG